MKNSVLKTQMLKSPLGVQSVIRPKGMRGKRSLIMVLILTSLVDAFCMLVIYLMFNVSPSGQASVLSNYARNLPHAVYASDVDGGTIVRIDQGRYYVGDNVVNPTGLANAFQQIRPALNGSSSIVIEANRNLQFSAFNPIILAAAQMGVHQFKFAVYRGGGSAK